MPPNYNVTGPAVLQVLSEADYLGGSTEWLDLGLAEDDDLFSFGVSHRNRAVGSSDMGSEPGEVIYTGSILTFAGTMSRYDESLTAGSDVIELLGVPPGGTDLGDAGIVGSRWVTGEHCLAFRLHPLSEDGRRGYIFPRCYTDDEWFQPRGFGNDVTRLEVSFVGIRSSGESGTTADGGVGTQKLYIPYDTATP